MKKIDYSPLMRFYSEGGEDYYTFIFDKYIQNGEWLRDEMSKSISYLIYLSYIKSPFYLEKLYEFISIIYENDELLPKLQKFKIKVINNTFISPVHKILTYMAVCYLCSSHNIFLKYLDSVIKKSNAEDLLIIRRGLRFLKQQKASFYIENNELESILNRKIKDEVCKVDLNKKVIIDEFSINNILIVLSFIPPNFKNGAHLMVLKNLIKSLVGIKSNVSVLLTNEDRVMTNDFLPYRFYPQKIYDNLVSELSVSGAIVLKTPCIDEPSYIKKVINNIKSCNPDVIIKIGGVLESSIFDSIIVISYPCIYRQFNMHNTPNQDYDLYLYQGSKKDIENKDKWCQSPIPVEYNSITASEIEKKHISKRIVKIVTVLSNGRIEESMSKYSDSLLQKIRSIFDMDIEWTFVGIKNHVKFMKLLGLSDNQSSKVIVLERHSELLELYEDIDIFAMLPKLTGGGGGVLMAVSKGVSTIVSNSSDASNFIDENYVYYDGKAFFDSLKNMIESKECRVRNAIANLTIQIAHHPDNIGMKFKPILKEAKLNYVNRINNNLTLVKDV